MHQPESRLPRLALAMQLPVFRQRRPRLRRVLFEIDPGSIGQVTTLFQLRTDVGQQALCKRRIQQYQVETMRITRQPPLGIVLDHLSPFLLAQ